MEKQEAIAVVRRDVRNYISEFSRMIAAFALLNMREHVETTAVRSAGRRSVGNHFAALLPHHLLTLQAPHRVVARGVVHAMAKEAMKKRRHEASVQSFSRRPSSKE